jgi:uridine kinase
MRGPHLDTVVVCLSGCTAAGKTTLASALQQRWPQHVAIVNADRHHLPPSRCSKLDLHALPWPSGIVPAPFVARGNADFNVPSSIDWHALERDVAMTVVAGADAGDSADAAQDRTPPRLIVVEGHLLFSAHPGAGRVRAMCDHHVVLDADGDDLIAMEALWRRKWQRSHLGKPSYESLGVTAVEYSCWWSSYCWPRWEEHGQRAIPSNALRLDCLNPTGALVDGLTSGLGLEF